MKKNKSFFKIFKFVLIIFVIFIIGFFSFVKWEVDANTKVNESNEKILISNNSNKKALIIYQPSRTELTSKMADTIGQTLNKSGYEVTINYPSENISYDISKYEIIVFGTPVYMGQPSPVLEKYIKEINDFSGKKVMIFVTGQLKNDTKEVEYLSELIKGESKIEKIKLIKGETDIATESVNDLIKE